MSQLVLQVNGIGCSGCEHRVRVVLDRLDGVGRVDADHQSGRVEIHYDPTAVTDDEIIGRLADAGYETVAKEQP